MLRTLIWEQAVAAAGLMLSGILLFEWLLYSTDSTNSLKSLSKAVTIVFIVVACVPAMIFLAYFGDSTSDTGWLDRWRAH
jgi:hypothetical protein